MWINIKKVLNFDIKINKNLMKEENMDNEIKEEKNKKSGNSSSIVEWVIVIAVAVAIALFINFVIIINSTVPTSSMENTIMPGDRILGLRVTYWFEDPKYGDIIVFKYPDNPSETFVKRVIGTPGDIVEVKSGVTYVNGKALTENYLKEEMIEADYGPYEVPEDSYFVMGDNRNNSLDSRFWETTHFVPQKNILGRAFVCYWPFSHMGKLKGID